MQYDNTNRGTLFRNEKRISEKAPEYEGKIDINGTEYKLAAWIRESKTGKKFFSLSVSSLQTKKAEPVKQAEPIIAIDEELPF